MSLPDLVRERLGDEQVEAAVPLGDDDTLVVTSTRTLLYRGEGLFSDASVEEYSHDAEVVSLAKGRRTSTIRLDHGVEGDSEFPVPNDHLEEVLPPLLSGILTTNGVLDPDERIEEVYRLGELTVLIAGRRVIKQVGDALWDEDAAVYDYDDVTGLDVEKGEVSSQLIVEVEGRPQWIKIPSDSAREIRERIESALLAYHDATTYREFERQQSADESDDDDRAEPADTGGATTESGDGIAGLDLGGDVGGVVGTELGADGDVATESGAGTDVATEPESGADVAIEPASSADVEELAAEVADLRQAVERQTELLETQQRAIERLIEKLTS